MFSLRAKLWAAFGGLLLILTLVSIVMVVVMTRYSRSLEQVLHWNYNSAVYCDAMRAALSELDLRAQHLTWNVSTSGDADPAATIARFNENLQLQRQNVSLPGEQDATNQLASLWLDYQTRYAAFANDPPHHASIYQRDLLTLSANLQTRARHIAEMNMANISSVDGTVKHTLLAVRNTLLVLVIAGTLAAGVVIGTVGASILKPLSALTHSAQQIEAGNLDLTVEVRSRDEVGRLAKAFDAMANRLREFRQFERDRLARTQLTTQLAIDSLPDAVCVLDPTGLVEISNTTAQVHFQIKPGVRLQTLGLPWLTDLHHQVVSAQAAQEPAGYQSAIQLFEQGQEKFLLPRAVPMLDKQGTLIGVTAILVDVTRLRYADELKSGLVSTVSHELRTPLTSIRMAILMLIQETLGPLTDRQRQALIPARDDSERLHRIIDNILNISRIESGKARFDLRPVSPVTIVTQTVDALRSQFAQKRQLIQVAMGPDVPHISGDATCIAMALGNLLTNALKYAIADQPVEVVVSNSPEWAEIGVIDHGPGIPEEYRGRLFEKFFRGSHPNGPTGAGLGLSITREIVEAHGGRVQFSETPSGGCTFTMRFPILISGAEAAG